MLLRRLVAAASLGCSVVLWSPAGALAQELPQPAARPVPMEVAAARQWIQRLQQAASQRNYAGTQVFSSGGTVSSARVVHFGDGAQQLESVEMLDGQMRRVFRHNDLVYTLWPKRHLAVVEQRPVVTPFPSLPHQGSDLFDSYELLLLGTDRQAGHDVEVVMLRPRDQWRFGQRLWAELSTGLLLRTEVVNRRGDVLESAAFSEVAINVRPQPEAVLMPIRKLDGYKVVRLQPSTTQLENEGWSLRPPVPGFRQVSCVKRPLQGPRQEDGASPSQVLHAIYSDGLTHVSLFVEPFDAERHERPIQMTVGATHTLMTRRGDWWLTVVGDVPAETLKRFASALERRKP